MKKIDLMKGKKGGTPEEKLLYDSYLNLSDTRQLGSDVSKQALVDHLSLMLPTIDEMVKRPGSFSRDVIGLRFI